MGEEKARGHIGSKGEGELSGAPETVFFCPTLKQYRKGSVCLTNGIAYLFAIQLGKHKESLNVGSVLADDIEQNKLITVFSGGFPSTLFQV